MKLRRRDREPADQTTDGPVDQPTGADVPTAADEVLDPVDETPADPIEPEATVSPEADPPVAPADEAAAPPHRGLTSKGRVRHTRASALWVGVIVAAVLAIFLLIFIAQNSAKVSITFLGFEGQISLAIALLLAAIIGVLVVALPGSLRIMQLRRALRKNAADR